MIRNPSVVKLRASSSDVLALALTGPPDITGGDARIEDIEIEGGPAATRWRGYTAVRVALPVVVDLLAEDGDVRDVEDRLIRWRRPVDGRKPGTRLTWDTEGAAPYDRVRAPDLRWWLEAIEWGPRREGSRGQAAKSELTVKLAQAVRAPSLETRPRRGRDGGPILDRKRIVRYGETAATVADDELGDPAREWDILDASGIRDPRSVTPGTTLVIPENTP